MQLMPGLLDLCTLLDDKNIPRWLHSINFSEQACQKIFWGHCKNFGDLRAAALEIICQADLINCLLQAGNAIDKPFRKRDQVFELRLAVLHCRGIITRNSKISVDHFHANFFNTTNNFLPALCRDFKPYKPSPAALLHICSGWNIKPQECLMVGDSVKDDVSCSAT